MHNTLREWIAAVVALYIARREAISTDLDTPITTE